MTDSLHDILHKGFQEYRRFVNPLIFQRASLAREPITIRHVVNGVPQHEGQPLEDFHGTQTLGHRRPEIADAIRAYLDGDAPNWYMARVNPFVGRLARRLFERTGYDNAYFAMSGADANEAAIKLARARRPRSRILGLAGAYHGCSMGAASLMQPGPFKDPFAPFVDGITTLPFADTAALEHKLSRGDVGAVIVEPIQVEGGARPLPQAYIEALCTLTARHDTLLVADEVQTGMGRTGRSFLGTESWPRRPDVVLLAKALGGGLVPISAMLTRAEIFHEAYGRDFASGESHNTTFGSNALTAVAALAALELVTPELISRVQRVGAWWREHLRSTLEGHPLFDEVRGDGLVVGIVFKQPDHPWLSFEHFGFSELDDHATIAPLICHRLYRRGFFCYTCGHDWRILRLQPRLDIPQTTLERFTSALRDELDTLAALL